MALVDPSQSKAHLEIVKGFLRQDAAAAGFMGETPGWNSRKEIESRDRPMEASVAKRRKRIAAVVDHLIP